jgi:sec-independent protein translocase protein TatA
MFEGILQPMHLMVILVAGLLLFGPKKLPELGKGLGEGIRGFKDALDNAQKPNGSAELQNGNQSDPATRDPEIRG